MQIETFKATERKDAVPVFMLALFLVLLIPAPTRRNPRVNIISALIAFGLCLLFVSMAEVEIDKAWLFAAGSMLFVAYLLANHVSRRVLTVALSYARASNLTRYFSPAVAEQIGATGVDPQALPGKEYEALLVRGAEQMGPILRRAGMAKP